MPQPARSLFDALAGGFTRPTFLRWVVLALATILTVGRRAVCNLLRTLGALAPGHPSSFHRVFSQRRWSAWRLARGLATWVVDHLVPAGRIPRAGDDTVAAHPGAHVFGKGCHRDPVRSTHSFTAFRWGHKWVVLAVLVRFPFARRQWALPLLVALYRSAKDNQQAGRRHKTPARLLRQLCCVLLRWFRPRQFVLSADGNYGSHEMARFAARRRGRLTLVSKFAPDARLYRPPPPYSGRGRPRVKGGKLPTPQEVVARRHRTPGEVAWYGGGRRKVATVTGTGHWYKSGHGLVAVRWVFVQDRTGSHRDEYFFTTDVGLSAPRGHRNLRRPLERRNHLSRVALVLGLGNDTRLEGADGVAGGPVPVRALHAGELLVQPVAPAVRSGPRGRLARQAGRDVLRRHNGGPPLALAGMGFCIPWASRRLSKTLPPFPAGPTLCSGPCGLSCSKRQKSNSETGELRPEPWAYDHGPLAVGAGTRLLCHEGHELL